MERNASERGDTSGAPVERLRMKTETICARVAATALNQGATTAMPRRRIFKKPDTWEYGHDAPADEKPLARPGKRRAATMLVYGALFFAGAAFTAFAGDQFSHVSQDSLATADSTTTTDAAATDAAPADGSADTSSATGSDYPDALTPTHTSSAPSATTSGGGSADGTTAAGAPATPHHSAPAAKHAAAATPFVLLPKIHPAPKPELEG